MVPLTPSAPIEASMSTPTRAEPLLVADRVLAAHQPNYLPNLAFFSKMKRANVFVIVSNLQFSREDGFQQRNRIPGGNADLWLTVPVTGGMNDLIRDIKVCNDLPWARKHLKTLRLRYPQAAGSQLMNDLTAIYSRPWERMAELNFALIRAMADALNITTELVLDEEVGGKKHELIVNLCQKYQAAQHLAGRGSLQYMNQTYLSHLERLGITTEFITHDFTASHPYSALHYLLAEGPEWVKKVI